MRKLSSYRLLPLISAYCAFTALFSFALPSVADAEQIKKTDYFIGDVIAYCPSSICFESGSYYKVGSDSRITTIVDNYNYSNEDECKGKVSFYKSKIQSLDYFPLFSNDSDFGGIFKVDGKSYHAKMKCSNGLIIAKITTI